MINYLLIPFLSILLFSCSETESTKQPFQGQHNKITSNAETEDNSKQIKTTQTNSTFLLNDLLSYNSEKELISKFGSENITQNIEYGPEGMGETTTTVLYAETPNEVIFSWSDDTKLENLHSVKVQKKDSQWKTIMGIHIGTTLKELESINDKVFNFYGFEWDFGGQVSWNDGVLEKKNISCTLGYIYDYGNPNLVLPEAYEALIGDQEFLSSDKNAQEVDITVIQLSLFKKA